MSAPPAVPKPHGYPKSARLRRDRDFQGLRVRSRRHTGREASIRVLATTLGRARLGLSTSRKYGNAVRRNRFRRLAREAFRHLGARLGSRDFLVEPRRDLVEPSLEGLTRDLEAAAGLPRP